MPSKLASDSLISIAPTCSATPLVKELCQSLSFESVWISKKQPFSQTWFEKVLFFISRVEMRVVIAGVLGAVFPSIVESSMTRLLSIRAITALPTFYKNLQLIILLYMYFRELINIADP